MSLSTSHIHSKMNFSDGKPTTMVRRPSTLFIERCLASERMIVIHSQRMPTFLVMNCHLHPAVFLHRHIPAVLYFLSSSGSTQHTEFSFSFLASLGRTLLDILNGSSLSSPLSLPTWLRGPLIYALMVDTSMRIPLKN